MAQVITNMLTLSGISRRELHNTEVDLGLMVSSFLTELRDSDPGRSVLGRA
jgi:hypothetical protein